MKDRACTLSQTDSCIDIRTSNHIESSTSNRSNNHTNNLTDNHSNYTNNHIENSTSNRTDNRNYPSNFSDNFTNRSYTNKRTNRSTNKRIRNVMTLICALLIALASASCSSSASKNRASEASGGMAANEAHPSSLQQNAFAFDGYAGAGEIKSVQDQSGSEQGTSTRQASAAQEASAPRATIQQDAVPPAVGAGIGTLADPGASIGRKVIYKANVSMKVDDFETAELKLRDLIHMSSAYILQFNNHVSAGEKGATYVVKVPAAGFSDFIDQLRSMHKDAQLSMEGSDVTEEYVDLEARLKAKQAAESRLLAFMDKATGTSDLIRFQSELSGIQEQIEQLKGRMRYLDQNVAYSTVHIRMYESKSAQASDGQDNLGERMTQALIGSAKALGQFGQALLVFAASLFPIIAVIAVIGIPVYLSLRRQRRSRKQNAANMRRISDSAVQTVSVPAPVESEDQSSKETDR